MWRRAARHPRGALRGGCRASSIVVLLTPAVGGMARLLGVVDRPGRAPAQPAPDPAPRRARALPRHPRAGARLPRPLGGETRGLLLGAAVATTVGAIDDFRGLAWWQKLGGQVVAAAIPAAFGIWVDRFTFPFLGIHELPAWVGIPLTIVWIVAIMNMVNFLDGLDGLAAGVCGDRGRHVLRDRALARQAGRRRSCRRSSSARASASCATTSIRRGSSWATRARCCSASCSPTLSVQGLLKTAATVALFFPLLVLAVPILDTSFVVARRLKHGEPVYGADRRTCTTASCDIGFSQRRAALTMWVWCGTLAAAALATRFIPFREGGDWHLWGRSPPRRSALVALAVLGLHRLPARDREAGRAGAAPHPRSAAARALPRRPSGHVQGRTLDIVRPTAQTSIP